ncbi:8-amino-7-oxononanoate synthase [Oceanicoccus sp. KOV_DT_Chl]|uniref:8-amino-7-oxononanoate synthase n=1 Tax=Oceanicoccus sp. KOV_DT_Chl TaxID=1904639 RepID=UPI000C7A3CD3|nr:8-amino-7-oxononanoate synthase [Oceanicoccus sp. KOV_DT_Chl]
MADFSDLSSALSERKANHLYRQRRELATAQGATVVVEGKTYINFCSNDYLGLANHPDVLDAFQQAASEFGVGSGSSHLVCGHSSLHHQLEQRLAAFLGRDRALLFSTGYMANLGVINALLGKNDFIFQDKLNHASLLDAGLLSGARFQRFLHNDIASLETRLQKADAGRKLIAVDAVFSMDGDLAPLQALSQLAEQYDACLMADDAHGVGVLGQRGAGCAEFFNLDQQQLPIVMGTLGKSFGSFGAFVAGSEDLIETLIQFSRSYIYTTALPPAVAAASLASLKIIQSDAARRQHLQALIGLFKAQAQALGLPLMPSDTAIQPLLIGSSEQALVISDALAAKGFLISAIRPPTVPANSARLRITLTAAHTVQQLEELLSALAEVAW